MPDWIWIAGFAAAAIVSAAAWRLRALDWTGTVAATAVGTLIVGCAGWWAGVILVAFFVTASALSLVTSEATPTTIEQVRGTNRDWVQVLANGGIATLFAVASAVAPAPQPWLVGFAAAVAAATADTWATEVGRLMGATPRSLADWSPVTPGTSGAVSGPGTLGAAAGAALIGGLAAMGTISGWWELDDRAQAVLVAVAMAGFAGCFVDSVLGATIQAKRWCPLCERFTERAVHDCNVPTVPAGGIRWITNDVVNIVAVAFAALAGLVAGSLIV
ncbi:MAG TPA: DUF92 domain-containing protein [Thermomicrobiales bacterium]|nr:DUF92 domain-containing protein [Thermomicrobiales bacterium]